tara:strand:- start:798 stop:1559 length:762 start_codon:yes stop_codon:yes gene_type:complete
LFFFVIPTLNSSDTLSRLVNSLKNQSFLHWRVIFIDGGSDKHNLDQIKSYCINDYRFNWKKQTHSLSGIYGAMNDGFNEANDNEWLIFWGADDWAFSDESLKNLSIKIKKMSKQSIPDLIICDGKYINNNKIIRSTKFNYFINYWTSIFLGGSPPHQGTLFGLGVRKVLNHFETKYRLAADLDYFSKLSYFKYLKIKKVNLNFVKIGCGGVSQQKSKLRFYEVSKIYKERFSIYWFIPFISRYIYRIITLIRK